MTIIRWERKAFTWYYPTVEYPFPPVGIVGAADGKNRRAFLYSYPSSVGLTLELPAELVSVNQFP